MISCCSSTFFKCLPCTSLLLFAFCCLQEYWYTICRKWLFPCHHLQFNWRSLIEIKFFLLCVSCKKLSLFVFVNMTEKNRCSWRKTSSRAHGSLLWLLKVLQLSYLLHFLTMLRSVATIMYFVFSSRGSLNTENLPAKIKGFNKALTCTFMRNLKFNIFV